MIKKLLVLFLLLSFLNLATAETSTLMPNGSFEQYLDNWVKLPIGKVVCMHFREYQITPRLITDTFWKTQRTVNSLLFLVDRVDGKPVDQTLSVVSERLAMEFQPYLEDESYKNYLWCLVKDAEGFTAPRIVSRTRVN